MATRLPPLNPLRSFEAAARHLSVTRAAEELNVTHGAISHQIRALESRLGVKLFHRDGGSLRLTAHGSTLLGPVSGAFEQIASATSRLSRPSTQGKLTINCVPAFLSFWLIPRLTGFFAQFPEVHLNLVPSNDPKEIFSPAVDINILYGDANWSNCWVELLANLQLFPVCAPALLHAKSLRGVHDLEHHALLHGDDGGEWNNWLASVGAVHISRPHQHFLSDARIAIEAASHGVGLALGDNITCSASLEAGRLIRPFEQTVPASFSFFVACKSDLRSVPVVTAFIDWLFSEVAYPA